MIENLYTLIEILELLIGVLIGIAFLTLAERKILGAMQRRVGPQKVGLKGLTQSIADGIKLILKESIMTSSSNKFLYQIAPILALTISLLLWTFIPFSKGIINTDIELAIILIMGITSLNVYSVLYSGWASNSKYGFLGSLRSVSQLISYEVSLGLIILNIVVINKSFNLTQIIENQIFISNIYILFPIFIIFIITILAETLRSPFDIVEAESELVAGNLVEYGGFTFAAMYLAEYSNIIFYSCLTSFLFFGYYILSVFTFITLFIFIWVRASLPRLRWDHLLDLGWTKILPFSIGYLIFVLSIFSL